MTGPSLPNYIIMSRTEANSVPMALHAYSSNWVLTKRVRNVLGHYPKASWLCTARSVLWYTRDRLGARLCHDVLLSMAMVACDCSSPGMKQREKASG